MGVTLPNVIEVGMVIGGAIPHGCPGAGTYFTFKVESGWTAGERVRVPLMVTNRKDLSDPAAVVIADTVLSEPSAEVDPQCSLSLPVLPNLDDELDIPCKRTEEATNSSPERHRETRLFEPELRADPPFECSPADLQSEICQRICTLESCTKSAAPGKLFCSDSCMFS